MLAGRLTSVDMSSGEMYGYAEGLFDFRNPNPDNRGELAYGRTLQRAGSATQLPPSEVARRPTTPTPTATPRPIPRPANALAK